MVDYSNYMLLTSIDKSVTVDLKLFTQIDANNSSETPVK